MAELRNEKEREKVPVPVRRREQKVEQQLPETALLKSQLWREKMLSLPTTIELALDL